MALEHEDLVLGRDDVVAGEENRSETESKDDAALLRTMGYKPVLHRTYTLFENFATTFAALYFVGGVRVTFSTGIAAGGNLAYWTSYLVTMVFTFITAAVIAEVCSASPSAGSIYLWAAEAGGPRFGRLLGFIVAWWSTTAWTTFCASNTQSAVNYMLAELTVFNVDFPKDTDDVKFRAVQWICTEILLALAALLNFMPPRYFKAVFWLSAAVVMLDFLLNLIWLPIGTAQTWGFRTTHEAFMTTYNGTGAPAGWNWCLSYLATAGILIGFDASGHVAEETKNASVTAARGIFWSTVASGFGGLATIILFLFCAPDNDTLLGFGSPQPFVPLYEAVLGRGGHIPMNVICVVALWLNTAIAIIAASRLVFAVARDGVLPFSGWVSKVHNGQPRNAVIVVLFCTPKRFPKPAWSLGRWSKPFQLIGVFWNGWVVAILFSPYAWPVTGENLNYAPIIMAGVTIFALISYFVMPESAWLPRNRITHFIDSKGAVETVEEIHPGHGEPSGGR
ncbi:hypothetical protein N7450_003494 [Penicillium hetheringtonii]|uniref:Amino acid transporter n=1 Tax=Penicillium hetheringtonii TaxID=911720 RepID=A0AAD6DXW5_9EURO|nr:hypothetical protein N7450_003494 [Penicillium hetheringtonii]